MREEKKVDKFRTNGQKAHQLEQIGQVHPGIDSIQPDEKPVQQPTVSNGSTAAAVVVLLSALCILAMVIGYFIRGG